jgi:hypothetical protein
VWKEGIKLSDIHRQLFAVCGDKAPACSSAFKWVWSFNSDKETAQVAVRE